MVNLIYVRCLLRFWGCKIIFSFRIYSPVGEINKYVIKITSDKCYGVNEKSVMGIQGKAT